MEDREIIQLFFDRDERAIAESRDKYGKYCDGIAAGILHARGQGGMRKRYLAACVADHSAAESGLAQGVPWAAVPLLCH